MYTKCGHREVCPRAAITFFWVTYSEALK